MSKGGILYIEEKPIKRELRFPNHAEFIAFWNPYLSQIIDYCWDKNINYKDYYVYHRHLLNKDGSIRKPTNPTHLRSKESVQNQKIGWQKYIEKRKKATQEKSLRKKIMDNKLTIDRLQAENLQYEEQLKELLK